MCTTHDGRAPRRPHGLCFHFVRLLLVASVDKVRELVPSGAQVAGPQGAPMQSAPQRLCCCLRAGCQPRGGGGYVWGRTPPPPFRPPKPTAMGGNAAEKSKCVEAMRSRVRASVRACVWHACGPMQAFRREGAAFRVDPFPPIDHRCMRPSGAVPSAGPRDRESMGCPARPLFVDAFGCTSGGFHSSVAPIGSPPQVTPPPPPLCRSACVVPSVVWDGGRTTESL